MTEDVLASVPLPAWALLDALIYDHSPEELRRRARLQLLLFFSSITTGLILLSYISSALAPSPNPNASKATARSKHTPPEALARDELPWEPRAFNASITTDQTCVIYNNDLKTTTWLASLAASYEFVKETIVWNSLTDSMALYGPNLRVVNAPMPEKHAYYHACAIASYPCTVLDSIPGGSQADVE